MKKVIVSAGAVLLAVSLTGCVGQFDTFQKAYEDCGSPLGVEVADEGKTITIDSIGSDDWTGASYSELTCVVSAVGTPDYINNNIMSVRALDGRQTEEFDGIVVSYSFHPDNGATIVFHKK